ncbi:MAG TPA: CaiB/BaiF CoA-transferase family protein [Stellaceae bacterium]|nr:CaiB/BaiF CoA-transferase family protein [Stellaceae bacterium]
MSETEATLPLAGLRVAEFSHAIMGPSAGMVLADLGAEVIKVEPAPDGDRTRRLTGSGVGFFGFYNRNKKSLAIDLKSPKARPVIEALIKRSDVLIENFAVGTMDRLGLGYEAVSALNPRLVYAALKGFLSGPYETRRALDEVAQMMSGLAYMTGPPGQPLRAGASVIDVMGGFGAVIGILASLRERDRTGKGGRVTSGLFEAAAFLMGQHMVNALYLPLPLAPMSVRNSAWGVYDVFTSREGKQIFIGIVTETQWRRFCAVFGREDLLAEKDFADNTRRVAARPRLVPLLTEFFREFPAETLIAKSEEAELAFAPVNQPTDLFDDPHLNAGGNLRETKLPDGKVVKVPRLPIEIDGAAFTVRQDPPQAGANSREVLRDLGFNDGAIETMLREGIVSGVG